MERWRSGSALSCQSGGRGFDPRRKLDISEMPFGVSHSTYRPDRASDSVAVGRGQSSAASYQRRGKNGTSIPLLGAQKGNILASLSKPSRYMEARNRRCWACNMAVSYPKAQHHINTSKGERKKKKNTTVFIYNMYIRFFIYICTVFSWFRFLRNRKANSLAMS